MNIRDELNNLDPNNPGVWPWPFQLGLLVIVFVLILGASWKLDVSGQRDTLTTKVAKEEKLKSTFEVKQKKAANLPALKNQMKEMKQSFGDLLRQLPNKTEIAGLIVDISQTGLAAGLQFDLFKPQKEKPAEFYAELPINIVVNGTYHQLGKFISGLASLPRIVTTHNINIVRVKGKKGGPADELRMSAIAKTYRALDEDEHS
ncbi:MAG: type 4a pilus biogenesis protein PilO [Gammaproteobacteria bacterium]|jgi:type IV pilus assembly protein PilO